MAVARPDRTLGWLGIARLGLVQTALGSIVVLTTSTLNRVMVVELALAAVVPGLLVGLHYAVQMARPVWGHASDVGGRRTPWIVGGVAALGFGALGAAVSVAVMANMLAAGLVLAALAFVLVGFGVGAAGTSLLALLASCVAAERRPAAATVVWLMMIAGMALTALLAGGLLEPYSHGRLVVVVAAIGALAFALTVASVWRLERMLLPVREATRENPATFRDSLADAWADPRSRLFTVFVFVSMLAFSAQDLILEPFAGLLFSMTPGETTRLAGIQHGGVFAGMVLTGLAGTLWARRNAGALRVLTIAGCVGSAAALAGLAAAAANPGDWPLRPNVFLLGFANGCFAVAAIGSMMALAGAAGRHRAGMRMGLWGAAQAIAFGLGGLAGAAGVDLVRALTDDPAAAFGLVFAVEAATFLAAAAIALGIAAPAARDASPAVIVAAE